MIRCEAKREMKKYDIDINSLHVSVSLVGKDNNT